MTLLRSKWVLLLMLLASATSLSARPFLHSLDIRVVLSRNGDAHITETRVMDIDSEGTECYIGLGNMGGSEVRDLKVSDENGLEFTNIGSWDVDRSRDWKAGKCGIVYKHNGYELCWGLGDSGSRTYTTRYVITSLVHAYPDADAIRHVFLDQDVSPKPDKARLSIEAEDSTLFSEENCGVWGFRFGGELSFDDGKIIVYNTEPFDYRGALYIMVRFDKGLFEPTIQEDDTFEHKKELAFEGSDYMSDDEEWTWEDTLILLVIALSFFVVPVIGLVWYFVYVWRARKKVNKDLLWYRDIPLNGNLQQANDMLNAYKYLGTDYNNLLSACILKLIDMGAISIEETLNRKGKTEQNFVIHELKNPGDQPLLLRKIHSMFKTAAGDDTILEPKELRSFMRSSKNESITDSFINTLHTKTSISNYKERLDDVRQVFGLKKFLKEFSLLDERHVNEVSLWKDYMIYATLFGIADQVIKDMKKINPEYFNMDQVAAQMANDHTLPVIYSTLHSGTSRAVANKAAREARASGHGGHSSWGGGGGGFSGGGFGGGVR
ncbi:MAG: DUF2207 domain-containing protein [Prevotella sp.]|nr:DUF2207 domain-containing protein [Prevotella sp.]